MLDCPICGFGLRGSRDEGYRCVQCHARFGHSFVRDLRRREFSELISQHFTGPPMTAEEVTILPIELEEVANPVPSVLRLEEVLDWTAKEHGPEVDLRADPVSAMFERRKDRYDPRDHRP